MANIFSGHSYQLVTTGASYAIAKSAAVDAGGYLVIINSQAENDFVYGLLSNAGITTTAADGGGAQYVWIGASDATTEGAWQWVDGTSAKFHSGPPWLLGPFKGKAPRYNYNMVHQW